MLRDAVARARQPRVVQAVQPRVPLPLAGLRLLVVEDNPVNQQIARELLGARGAEVEVVEDGRPAVEAIAAGRVFDAVLMDMLMPGMDGIEATTRIRQDVHGRRVPIIAMTANAMDSDREACLAAGMDDHVGKPVVIEQVVRAILRQVRERDVPRAAAEDGPPDTARAVLDRAAAIARLGGNTELFERLLPVFRTNLRKSAADAQAAVAAGAHEILWRAMHSLRGMAGTLGAPALAHVAGEAETRLRAGAPVDDASVDAALHAVSLLLQELG
jgi:two-component system sensor histidine kinase/response regulator